MKRPQDDCCCERHSPMPSQPDKPRWRVEPDMPLRIRTARGRVRAALIREAIAVAQDAARDGRHRWVSVLPGQPPKTWAARWAALEHAGPDGQVLGPLYPGGPTRRAFLAQPPPSEAAMRAAGVEVVALRARLAGEFANVREYVRARH